MPDCAIRISFIEFKRQAVRVCEEEKSVASVFIHAHCFHLHSTVFKASRLPTLNARCRKPQAY